MKLFHLGSPVKNVIRTRIFYKSLLLYAFLLLLNLGLSIVIILYNQSSIISRVEVQEKFLQNNKFRQTLSEEIATLDYKNRTLEKVFPAVDRYFQLNRDFVAQIRIFDSEGRIQVSYPEGMNIYDRENEEKVNALDKRLVLKLFFKYNMDRTDYLYEFESESFLFSYMIFPVKESIYILKTTQYMESFARFSRVILFQVLIVLAISLVIHAAFSLLIYRNIIMPIRRLNRWTKKIIQGNLNEKIKGISNDEIGELSESFNEMIVAIENLKNEAQDSNPLTGLPGNMVIMNQITKKIESGEPYAVAYIDLDNFKPFNDKFGFHAGDLAISLLGDILKEMKAKYEDIFVGHTGGDDFVFISGTGEYELVGNGILQEFAARSRALYPADVIREGSYVSRTRTGEVQRFDLLSISIGAVTNRGRQFSSYAEIIQELAKMKKYAKGFPGNVMKIDMRDREA